MARQGSLLGVVPAIQGLRFKEEFITPKEESALLERLRSLEFHEMKMRGVVAKRRVIHYGVNYSFETFKATPGAPIPEFTPSTSSLAFRCSRRAAFDSAVAKCARG